MKTKTIKSTYGVIKVTASEEVLNYIFGDDERSDAFLDAVDDDMLEKGFKEEHLILACEDDDDPSTWYLDDADGK